MRVFAALCLTLTLTAPAVAEEGSFTVSVAGLRAGQIAYKASESAGSYKANGQVASTGLARGLYPAKITAAASGQVSGNRYSPSAYSDQTTKKGKTKNTKFRFSGGVPKVTKNPPDTKRKSYHANPASQKGSVDLMTAAYAILRDRPADLACDLDISPYDGRERTRIRLSGGKRKGDTLVCPGVYTRVAGFSAEDMAEKVNWPFTVTYQVQEGGLHRVREVRVPTTMGSVVLRRR